VGIETHVCVYQTAIDLIDDGFEVYVVGDAVSSRKLENKQIGIQAMKDAGAKTTSVEMALFEMLQVAEGDKFKQITKIVK
jgi:nicotinamidase-related amidase